MSVNGLLSPSAVECCADHLSGAISGACTGNSSFESNGHQMEYQLVEHKQSNGESVMLLVHADDSALQSEKFSISSITHGSLIR